MKSKASQNPGPQWVSNGNREDPSAFSRARRRPDAFKHMTPLIPPQAWEGAASIAVIRIFQSRSWSTERLSHLEGHTARRGQQGFTPGFSPSLSRLQRRHEVNTGTPGPSTTPDPCSGDANLCGAPGARPTGDDQESLLCSCTQSGGFNAASGRPCSLSRGFKATGLHCPGGPLRTGCSRTCSPAGVGSRRLRSWRPRGARCAAQGSGRGWLEGPMWGPGGASGQLVRSPINHPRWHPWQVDS